MSRRRYYEVRIRENGVKKSRFYFAGSTKQAAECYKGPGHIMWVEKAGTEKVLGVGEFFGLGTQLIRDLRNPEDSLFRKLEEERRGISERGKEETTN